MKIKKVNKKTNKQKGTLGEDIAVNYLKDNGYSIIKRNYTKNFAEIDILASIKDIMVVIEVKSRKNNLYTNASDSVNERKINKIKKLASLFLQENRIENLSVRFDIIEYYFDSDTINHIKDAF